MDGKDRLRQEMLERRMNLTPLEVAEKSELIISRLLGRPEFSDARSVLAYISFRQEVETAGLLQTVLAGGQKLYVPVTDWNRKEILVSQLLNYPDDLTAGRFGLLEPKEDCQRLGVPGDVDLAVVPGVAFDERGYRLGYGAGFYDRFLAALPASALKIGLGYEQQIVPSVYPQGHDQPVDLVITEKRTIDVRLNQRGE